MILLDVNLLLYAYDDLSPHHPRAREWFELTLKKEPLIAIPWQTIWAFLRISTNRTILDQPMAMKGALEIVDCWLAEPNVHLLTPGDGYWQTLKGVILEGQVRGPRKARFEVPE